MLIEQVPAYTVFEYTGLAIYPVAFRFYNLTSILVRVVRHPDEPRNPDMFYLVYGIDYTVVGNSSEQFGSEWAYTNGSLTLTPTGQAKMVNGYNMVIMRNTDRSQNYRYIELDSFPADSHENALTKNVAMTQEIWEAVDRAVQLPLGLNMTPEEFADALFQTAEDAKQSAEDAAQSASDAAQSATDAANSATNAANSANSAAQSASDAAQSATDAANSASQVDQIIEDGKNDINQIITDANTNINQVITDASSDMEDQVNRAREWAESPSDIIVPGDPDPHNSAKWWAEKAEEIVVGDLPPHAITHEAGGTDSLTLFGLPGSEPYNVEYVTGTEAAMLNIYTIYVDAVTGNDSNSGTELSPLKTGAGCLYFLSNKLLVNSNPLVPGNIMLMVYMAPGTYTVPNYMAKMFNASIAHIKFASWAAKGGTYTNVIIRGAQSIMPLNIFLGQIEFADLTIGTPIYAQYGGNVTLSGVVHVKNDTFTTANQPLITADFGGSVFATGSTNVHVSQGTAATTAQIFRSQRNSRILVSGSITLDSNMPSLTYFIFSVAAGYVECTGVISASNAAYKFGGWPLTVDTGGFARITQITSTAFANPGKRRISATNYGFVGGLNQVKVATSFDINGNVIYNAGVDIVSSSHGGVGRYILTYSSQNPVHAWSAGPTAVGGGGSSPMPNDVVGVAKIRYYVYTSTTQQVQVVVDCMYVNSVGDSWLCDVPFSIIGV